MEQKAISSDLIRGHIDTIILHTLLDGDKFAQQISDCVEEKSQKEYKINQATLYSSLKRLESLKHVSSYWYDSPTGRRKYFKLTDLGKQTVENNLSSWSYSRAIIDKLIDCAPQPVYQTKIVEKIVEVPVEKTVYIQQPQQNIQKPIENADIKVNNSTEIKQINTENKQENTTNNDVNFRNILSGLIKTSAIQKPAPQELQPLNKEISNDKTEEKLKFNETISSTGYSGGKASSTGKIDFGDLALKASKEGYKLRISSKDSGVAPGKFLINKLNLYTSLAIYLIVMLEFLFFTSSYGKIINFSSGIIVSLILIFTAFPAIRFVQFFKNPYKKIAKTVSPDIIFTATIVVFNLLILTLTANLIAGVDFSKLSSFIPSFVMPCVLYVDLIAYYILKYFIARFSAFNVKTKKTAL